MTHSRRSATGFYPYAFALMFWALAIIPLFKPGLSLDTLDRRFLGRDLLARSFNHLRFAIGDRVFPTVLVGEAGQLYSTGALEMADFQHTNRFTYQEIRTYEERLDEMNFRLQQKGITFLVVISPDKASIYPQYVPDAIKVMPGPSRFEQFIRYMRRNGTTPIVDLRSELQQASQREPIYYKTDLHWNHLGGYIAYSRILAALSPTFTELRPHPLTDYRMVSNGARALALANVAGLPFLNEESWRLQPRFRSTTYAGEITVPPGQNTIRFSQNQDSGLPSALIFHDSFFLWVIPLLEPHFSRTVSIGSHDPRYWNLKWVDVVKPDVVILEFDESYLNFMQLGIPAFN